MGIKELDRKYELNEIISGDSIFCATGITSGELIKGIEIIDNTYISETLITHKNSNTKKVIKRTENITL
jgi:fructose-1,6-bisphosphatase II / sedoheptulose-1,7-bisphosphatase